jgi:Tol biopolymer transport system component
VGSIAWKDNETLAIANVGADSPGGEIFLISSITGQVEKLSSSPNDFSWLSAASGKLFAVETTPYSSIFITDFAEGDSQSHVKQIFNEHGSIDDIEWPEQEKLIYNSWASGKNELWQINSDGTLPRRITNDSHLTFGFDFSPVDRQIVFAALGKNGSSVFISDADGNNVRQLTEGPDDYRPRFTNDGRDIIFQRGSLIAPTIWRVSINSADSPTQFTGYYALQPSISPDGKTLAYQFMDAGTSERVWRIGLVDKMTGKFLNKLEIPYPVTERKTAWHPSGDSLTMVANFGDALGFLLLSPADGSYRKIENISTDKISTFAWSPDGKRLAFSINQSTSDAVLVDSR